MLQEVQKDDKTRTSSGANTCVRRNNPTTCGKSKQKPFTIYGHSSPIEVPILVALPLSEAPPPPTSFYIVGSGVTSTPVLRFSFHLSPGYSTINASQARPTATQIGPPDSTHRKVLNMAGLSPGTVGTTNVFCMNAIGLSGIIPARGPRQRVIRNSFSAALFARRPPSHRKHK